MLFTNTLVGLLAIGFLLLSSIATDHVRAAVHLWVAGDSLATVSRLALLGQPGVFHTTGLPWLSPIVVDSIHGALIVGSAVLHTIAIRVAVGGQAFQARATTVLAICIPVGYVLIASMLHNHAQRVQLMLGIAFVFVIWTAGIAWPKRHKSRGAMLISAVMCSFGVAMAASVIGLSVDGLDSLAATRLPPMPVLLLDLISALAMTMAFALVLFELLQHRIEQLSLTDPLTGMLNRRGLFDALKANWDGTKVNQSELVLAILDLDHFKRINDTFGHAMGDDVLVGFAKRLRETTRSTDILARWGGEEFVLLMPNTDANTGRLVAERARGAVAESPLADGAPLVTVSIGLATVHVATDSAAHDDLIACADARLYSAKKTRNCVVAA